MQKEQTVRVIDAILISLWGILLLVFPLVFTTLTTDLFILPKEIVIAAVVVVSLILLSVKMIVSEKVTLRKTPFDVPVIIFLFALLLSSVFAVNRADSLIAVVPVAVAGIGYFVITSIVKRESTVVFMLSTLLVGAGVAALVTIFSYFKVYPLFLAFTHVQSFTTFGSILEQAFYFALLLPIGISLALPALKGKTNNATITFGAVSIVLIAGLAVSILQLLTTQKPILLPFETGFQTAFAAISQDTGRIAQGFALGSGFGNYDTVFTRFKQAAFNANSAIWSTQFNQSSSFVLELLATTGILGFLSYLFLLFRAVTKMSEKKTNPVYAGLIILAILSFVFPFSFVEIALMFVLLGLFAGTQGIKNHKEYFDVDLKFVALKKGFISLQQLSVPSHEKIEYNRPTAIAVTFILLVVVAVVGWFGTTFVLSDMQFQKSLVLASTNNGTGTYSAQANAISTFPYRSAYYRIFSQTNIALAGSLASIQPKNSSPSAQAQSTMFTLIQQGITTGRQATTLSPQSVANWQNLSSIYRSIIGLGQNADTFAIQSSQQAILLDPTNPQEFIALGGIYYQLGQWDNAIQMFQRAVVLKQDYPNAYFNLGHAYEQKGDFQNAMSAYQAVKTLVANDPTNTDLINKDIAALQAKMGAQNSQTQPAPKITPNPTSSSQPLNLSGQQGPAKTTSPSPTQ